MRKHTSRAAWGICMLMIMMLFFARQSSAVTAHNGLTWQGPQTCLTCHESEASEMHASSHYQWKGPALYTVNGPNDQGKIDTALNSYCVSILGNWNACGSCHTGLGAKPEATATPAQLQNIDCLMCHQKNYKRVKVGGVFVPDTANMTITMDQAAQTVHLPERSNCIQCHAKGGGGDNNKRGDMTVAHATTTDRNFDVHMSSTGANITCQQCHTTEGHRIAGRGSDLRQTDLDVKVNCSTATCHTNKLTPTGHATADVNKHVNRVACQTCHIKTYARNASDTAATETTEVDRDWTKPVWNAALNRYEPTITMSGNLKPAYSFWNGTSWNYSLKETARYEASTATYPTSRPEGSISDSSSMLYPFKYKQALQPLANSQNVLVALDTSVYFSTGIYDTAVKAGLTNMGYPTTTPYHNVDTDTYQLITHEVMPQGNALTCTQCHTSTATQMNLKSMGYAMKGTQSSTCTQCHGSESIPSYTSVHSRHVTSQRYDCSWCHNFTRPERGLSKPSGTVTDSTAPSVTAFTIPSASSSLTVAITSFTATDSVGIAGYLLTESATKPSPTTAYGWTSSKPASYKFATTGAKTLYAWAKDVAGNVSTARTGTVTITSSAPPSDTTAPSVTSFTIQPTSSSLTVTITTFTATDNVFVTGYLVTETSTKPSAAAIGWTSARPTSYPFASAGAKTLYAWAKDAAGNVSNSMTGTVTITSSTPSDTTAPTVTVFSIPPTSSTLTVAITTFTATDNVSVTGYLVTESSTKPAATASGWTSTKPASYAFATTGAKTLYAWAKDAAGNISNSMTVTVTITSSTPSDTTAPTVTAFTIPSSSSSLTVAISTFTANDNVAVTGYLVTESATKPSATASGWSLAKPSSYTFGTAGAKTLYAWAKDAAGNVSANLSDNVTVTSSSGVANISTSSSLNMGSVNINTSVNKTLSVANTGSAQLAVTKVEVVGSYASVFKPSVTSFSVDPSETYSLQISFTPRYRRTYTATLRIYSNDPDTPVRSVTLTGSGSSYSSRYNDD